MKPFFLLAALFLNTAIQAQKSTADTIRPAQIVEAACGQCRFGLKSKGCDLAVRLDGKAYFVEGTGIDDHGDAHATDGFCNAVRKAEVKGMLVNERFVATYFRLLPEAAKKD